MVKSSKSDAMRLEARSELDFDASQELARLGIAVGRTVAGSKDQVWRSLRQRVEKRSSPATRFMPDLLFEKVAAGLGRIQLLKREDAGLILSREGRAHPPDFRVILPKGEQVLVEVIAAPSATKSVTIAKRHLDALTEYAQQTKGDLRIAIFWRDAALWTSTPVAAFTSSGALDLLTAMQWNDMARFGDYMLGTVHPFAPQSRQRAGGAR